MKLKEIIEFLNERIPEDLALEFDNVGLMGNYDLNLNISSIKIFMDLWPEDDNFSENTLIITHHPPLFSPQTPTYTIHSNWDIIDGGANESLSQCLNLEVVGYFDDKTNIGRICKTDYTFKQLKEIILDNFENVRIVNEMKNNKTISKIGVISGFGLKNPNYIKLANDKKVAVLISGDLTHETAIIAKNLGITLIDLGHHESEVPGLHALKNILEEIGINTEIIDKNPIENYK
jgi:dinuclear metal center YbgI/SA1388 family protein